MGIAIGIVTLVLLVGCAAFLAAAETALMRVSRIRVRYLEEKKVKGSSRLRRLIEDPDYFLPPLLFLTLLVQLTAASLATWVSTSLTHNAGIGVAVGTAVLTVFMFIFGELVPKAAASHNSERVALAVTGSVSAFSWFLRPLAMVFEAIARFILRVITGAEAPVDVIVREEGEIKAMVTVAEENDIIEEEEKEMIHSVFEFSDTLVREVMVPRPDMVTLAIESSVKDALETAVEHGYSRIPVYEGELDNVKGVLYAKDLLRYLRQGRLEHPIADILRAPFVVPETKTLSDLLHEFKTRKVHIAIAVDEHGTIAGIVTIEDLIEEIVGEIFDEYDREINLIEKVGEGRYRVDARLSLDDLDTILTIDLPEEEDVDTVGGLVLKILGHLPLVGETCTYNGVTIRVEKLRNNRISKVIMDVVAPDAEKGG